MLVVMTLLRQMTRLKVVRSVQAGERYACSATLSWSVGQSAAALGEEGDQPLPP
jgi:hypothetical protein